MRNWILASVAVMALGTTVASGPAAAWPSGGLTDIPTVNDVQQVQFFFSGREYCWYDDGWHGPGFYWCGYSWRRGYGWGGGVGWRGWHHRGGSVHRSGGHRSGAIHRGGERRHHVSGGVKVRSMSVGGGGGGRHGGRGGGGGKGGGGKGRH